MKPEQLISENYDIPFSRELSRLREPVDIGGHILANRLIIHPMEGGDFNESDNAPSELSARRYLRYARGGASLVWFEANAVQPDARSFDRQSMLTEANLDSFKRLIAEMKAINPALVIILQLTHSGRFSKKGHSPAPVISHHSEPLNERMCLPPDYPVVTDEYLDALPDAFVRSARLAYEAGFDGVDIKCCHLYLYSELLCGYDRPGRYGGCFENRARLYLDTVAAVRAALPERFIVTTRLGMSDMIPHPWGFAMAEDGSMRYDLTETIRLIGELKSRGVRFISLTMGTPYYNPNVNRPYGGVPSPEPPLAGVERIIRAAGELKSALPELIFAGAGYSYPGEAAPYVAAGAVEKGLIDVVGFGRMALCYPDFARDIFDGCIDRRRVCLTCGKCSELLRGFTEVGCPVRDSDEYMPYYKKLLAANAKA